MSRRFNLAPMTTGLRVFTGILFVMPPALLWTALRAPAPERYALWFAFAVVCVIYAGVWLLWRPTCFELDASSLRIEWPLRSRTVARSAVEGARILSSPELRREYGRGMRIGAGGLWGGFGLLRTRRATFSMWISRTDRLVIVSLKGARPLLVTPEDPERFVEELSHPPG